MALLEYAIFSGSVLVRSGCPNKNHRLGGLIYESIYSSQFWSPEVQDQGSSVACLGPSSGSQTSHFSLTWQRG